MRGTKVISITEANMMSKTAGPSALIPRRFSTHRLVALPTRSDSFASIFQVGTPVMAAIVSPEMLAPLP